LTTSLNGSLGTGALSSSTRSRDVFALRLLDGVAALTFGCIVAFWRWRKSRDPRFVPPFETSTVVTFVPDPAGVVPGWEAAR